MSADGCCWGGDHYRGHPDAVAEGIIAYCFKLCGRRKVCQRGAAPEGIAAAWRYFCGCDFFHTRAVLERVTGNYAVLRNGYFLNWRGNVAVISVLIYSSVCFGCCVVEHIAEVSLIAGFVKGFSCVRNRHLFKRCHSLERASADCFYAIGHGDGGYPRTILECELAYGDNIAAVDCFGHFNRTADAFINIGNGYFAVELGISVISLCSVAACSNDVNARCHKQCNYRQNYNGQLFCSFHLTFLLQNYPKGLSVGWKMMWWSYFINNNYSTVIFIVNSEKNENTPSAVRFKGLCCKLWNNGT